MTWNVVGTWATRARCTRFVVATFKNRMNEDFGPARNLPDLHGRSFFHILMHVASHRLLICRFDRNSNRDAAMTLVRGGLWSPEGPSWRWLLVNLGSSGPAGYMKVCMILVGRLLNPGGSVQGQSQRNSIAVSSLFRWLISFYEVKVTTLPPWTMDLEFSQLEG